MPNRRSTSTRKSNTFPNGTLNLLPLFFFASFSLFFGETETIENVKRANHERKKIDCSAMNLKYFFLVVCLVWRHKGMNAEDPLVQNRKV